MQQYNKGYNGFYLTGPVFSCEFTCVTKSFLPQFVCLVKSLEEVKLTCTIHSRSEYRSVFEQLQQTSLAKNIACSVMEVEWASSTDYCYITSFENIKKLFTFINERLYADAYLIADDQQETTPLALFESLLKQAYQNQYDLLASAKKRISSVPEFTILEEKNHSVIDGAFALIYFGTPIPWIHVKCIAKQEFQVKIILNKPSESIQNSFIEVLRVALQPLECALTYIPKEEILIYQFVLDNDRLRQYIFPLLDQHIFANYRIQLPSDQQARPISAFLCDKLKEAEENFQATVTPKPRM